MSLRSCDIKDEYRSLKDNVVQDFYIPLLREAKTYKRAVGYFSSGALVEISKGIAKMAKTGGKIQIVASPCLSSDDVEAIRKGYDKRKIIEKALINSLSSEHADYFSLKRLNLLAYLIADGILDIRIAITENEHDIGIYHEKMGLIEDAEGNVVAFSGSMNETVAGISINYEAIDVFCNWNNENDAERVLAKQKAFNSIWNNTEPNIEVMEFSKVTDEIIAKYKKKTPSFDVDREQFGEEPIIPRKGHKEGKPAASVPKGVSLYEYQKEAINTWVGENYRGIFDMATGTGKTYTGLGAIVKLYEDLNNKNEKLAVIIACPFQHLVEQWVEDIRAFGIEPIIGYSSSSQKDWKKRLNNAILDQKILEDKSFFCFICTNATFVSSYVQKYISKIKSPMLLVVDEAHNFGARSYARYLDDRFTYRLALSATLERYRDEEGTAFLYDFFGRKCIEYNLERAIKEKKLTPYKYYPIMVYLNDEELQDYEEKSFDIAKCIRKGKNGKKELSQRGKILLVERSRIIAAAVGKLHALREVIQPYKNQYNILVYCGAANINHDSDVLDVDASDIRQIEAVTYILGNDIGMKVAKFTSEESIEKRMIIREKFQTGDRLQALVAIKCLDEGVNIPGIRTAFILASTTNPKEYIQRRGRVLRTAKNKDFAEIYDFITLPRRLSEVPSLTASQAKRDLSLVKKELARLEEFGRLAMNRMESHKVISNIRDTYKIYDAIELTKEENDYEGSDD